MVVIVLYAAIFIIVMISMIWFSDVIFSVFDYNTSQTDFFFSHKMKY